jgi:CRP-like cAMP-binding protein
MDIQVREATTEEERRAIYRLRYRVYVEEIGCEPEFADRNERMLREPIDDWAHNLYATLDGDVVGAVRRNLRRDGPLEHEHLWDFNRFVPFYPGAVSMSTKLVVAPHKRGGLVMKHLCTANYRFGHDMGIRFDFLDCWPHLINLYEHLGYRRYKSNVSHPEAGYMTPMVLVGGDVEHLEAVGSPFAAVARTLNTPTDGVEFFRRQFPDYVRAGGVQRLLSPDELWSLLSEKLLGSLETDVPLFRGMTRDEIQPFLALGNIINSRAGDRIVGMGQQRHEFYTLINGRAEVRIEVGGKPRAIRILEKGETFGEVAFLAQTARTADVVALEDCDVMVHDSDRVAAMERKHPEVALKFYRNLASIVSLRLAASNRLISVT